ncbi:MAG: DMT family transporter [Pseudomonadales bacterium]
MIWFSMFLVFCAGAMLPMQAGVNSQLARSGAGALWAAGISFFCGTLALLAIFALSRQSWPPLEQLKAAPLWAWSGGFMGAFFVSCMAFFAPKLGAATLLALIIAGQMSASVTLDHYGWLGFDVQSINVGRIAGLALIALGIFLIKRS